MGIAELRATVEARAREQIDAVRAEAEQRAVRLLAEARAEVERRRGARVEQERRSLLREQVARLDEVRRGARGRVLRSREALLERVFAAARRAVDGEPSLLPEASEVATRVERALAALPAGPCHFVCSPPCAEAVEAALAGREDATIEIDPESSPGFLARGAEGRLEVDARWDALLEQRRAELAIEVLRRVAEAGPP